MALPTSHNIVTAAQLGSTLSAYNTKLNNRFKPKQEAVSDPTADGNTAVAIDSISQDANGVITVTKKNISAAPASHTHGNITNDGKLQTNDVTIASGDKLVITDSSNSNKVARASIAFDGSTETMALTKKGTWKTFNNYEHPTTTAADAAAVKVGKDSLGHVVIGPALSKSDVGLGSVVNTGDSATPIEGGTTKFTTGGAYTELAKKADLDSPALTGTPTAPTATANTNTDQIATTAFVKTAIDIGIETADAMIYKGTIAGGSTGDYGALTAAASRGWTYKVSTAGKIDGVAVEVGDMLVCNTDSTAAATSSNYATIAANWDFIQANIDGAVTGPTSSVDAHVAVFNGTGGHVIKDSGFTIGKSVPSNAVFTDTNTKVTSAANHYMPTTASGSDKSASASGAPEAWGIDVVKGVTLNTDGKGHVTGISVTSGKIPGSSGITVTSSSVSDGANTFDKYTHPTTSGNKHIPSGGSSGQFLGWDSDGTAKWVSNPNSDTKVTQTLVAATATSEYPVLLAPTGQTATATTTANFATGAKYKPSTNTLSVNVSGNAATASAAKNGSALETAINGKAASSHTHGNVTSDGAITADAVDIASGDALTIVASSASGKLVKSSTTFDGSTTTQCLTKKGTWATFGTSNLAIGTTATTAAAGNHTHTASIATSTGTSAITLEPGGKYALTAGGSSVIFTNGTEMTDQEVQDLLDALP